MIYFFGYKIEEIFRYTNGKSDWQVYPPHGEYGDMYPSCTIQQVKISILDDLNICIHCQGSGVVKTGENEYQQCPCKLESVGGI